MNRDLRVSVMGLFSLSLLYVFSGFKYQESDPSQGSISEEPTVQMEVTGEGRVLVDPLGYLWVRNIRNQILEIYRRRLPGFSGGEDMWESMHRPEDSTDEGFRGQMWWDVLDSTGHKVTTVTTPRDVTVQTIGEGFIHGVWTDESGKKHVRLYSLDRSGSWSASEEPTVQMEMEEEGKILVDPLGYIWRKSRLTIYRGGTRSIGEEVYVQPRPRGPGMTLWDVFDSSGEEVTSRTRPSYVTIQTIGKDYIQAVWTGPESGLEYFGTYSLDRSGSDAESWVISQQTTVQIEVKEGSKILLDPLGYIWVRQLIQIYRGGSATSSGGIPLGPPPDTSYVTWQVFDSSGKRVTYITLPKGVSVQKIGGDFVKGIWTDKDGVEYVRMYSLDRGE